MKTAYELAMERLQKNAPAVPLTDEQKTQLAQTDSEFRAKIAEKELFLKEQIEKAVTVGRLEEAEQLRQQLAAETRRLEEDRESKKEKLRVSFAGS